MQPAETAFCTCPQDVSGCHGARRRDSTVDYLSPSEYEATTYSSRSASKVA